MLAHGAEDNVLLTFDFDYELPTECIAAHPLPERDKSRLLILSKDDGRRNHGLFSALPGLLRKRSLLVLNDTRVIPARLSARKPTGGRVEVFLVERVAGATAAAEDACWNERWRVLLRGLGSCPTGTMLHFDAQLTAELVARESRGSAVVCFRGRGGGGLLSIIEQIGSIPVPHYIESARRRAPPLPALDDRLRYQTVYARTPGAVAAPTAGLHFTEGLLARVRAAGHEIAYLTLHVGPGTFRAVTAADPSQHRLDGERYHIGEDAAAALRRAQAEGRPIVAVGTTVVRTLETLAQRGPIVASQGSTSLLILPGHEFRVVTDLVTNFHLPKSSLLMLVSAFAGREQVLAAYREAIALGYRFYSYGDAMFIRPGPCPPQPTSDEP